MDWVLNYNLILIVLALGAKLVNASWLSTVIELYGLSKKPSQHQKFDILKIENYIKEVILPLMSVAFICMAFGFRLLYFETNEFEFGIPLLIFLSYMFLQYRYFLRLYDLKNHHVP